MPIASFVASIPGRNSSAKHELIFLATKVPPLGSKSYYIETSASKGKEDSSISVPVWNSSHPFNQTEDLKISNEVIKYWKFKTKDGDFSLDVQITENIAGCK